MRKLILLTIIAVALAASTARAQGTLPIQILPFFFTVDLDLKDDGSGTMALTYPATPVTTFETERRRFASETTRATESKIRDGIVYTTVSFDDVTRLSQVADLSSVSAERTTDADGSRLVRARLRSPVLGDIRSDANVTIRVTLPGAVLKSNAQESAGRSALWKAPAKQFFMEDGIQIQVSYKPETGDKKS